MGRWFSKLRERMRANPAFAAASGFDELAAANERFGYAMSDGDARAYLEQMHLLERLQRLLVAKAAPSEEEIKTLLQDASRGAGLRPGTVEEWWIAEGAMKRVVTERQRKGPA